MNYRHLLPVLALLPLCGAIELHAQTGSIRGRVVDAATGAPLSGATIYLLDADVPAERLAAAGKVGRIADRDGNFEFMNVAPGSHVVKVTYVGYRIGTQNVAVQTGAEATVSIKLASDVKGLEGVVVTGAASRREKGTSEVAVSRVDAGSLTEANGYDDISQLLAAKVSGVTVGASSGNVGAGVRFNVRAGAGLYGNGQPVIFVDGVRVTNSELAGIDAGGQGVSTLADINPQDIENVEVLKGPAATALYGTSGSNGVVLITTKRGTRGQSGQASVQVRSILGMNEPSREYTPEMARSYNDANNALRNGPLSEHSVTVGGGNPAFNYYTSFERRKEDGILNNNNLERNSVRANFNAIPNDILGIQVSAAYISSINTRPQNDNSILGPLSETLAFGPDSAGNSRSYPDVDSMSVALYSNTLRTDRFIGSVEANVTPTEALNFRGVLGYDMLSNREDDIYPANGHYQNIGLDHGAKGLTSLSIAQMNFDVSAAYTYQPIDKLDATSTIGGQGFMRTVRSFTVTKEQFPTERITNLSSGNILAGADDNLSDAREAGIFFHQEAAYDKTWFLSFGVRNDYASSIGPDAPSILYPQVSGAVRLDQFDFLPKAINFLKLRAAYGESGILPGPTDASGLRWAGEQSGSGTGAVVDLIGNPTIEPERVREMEFGLEAEFHNAYGLDFTYYRQNTSNSIIDFLESPSSGLTAAAVPRNIGALKGWGFEAEAYATPVETQDYTLNLRLIWNYANNEVTDLGGASPIFDGLSVNAIAVGLSRSAFYGNKVQGATFAGDGSYAGPLVDTARSYLGTPVPVNSGSFTTSFRFLGDFTLSATADWGLGQSVLNYIKLYITNGFYQNNQEYAVLAAELGLTDAVGTQPVPGVNALAVGSAEYRAAAEKFAHLDPQYVANFVERADFVRLREVSLRYDMTHLMNSVVGASFIRNLALTVSARNLWLSTRYSFPDPEVNTDGARSLSRGQDFGTNQNPRVLNLMINIGF